MADAKSTAQRGLRTTGWSGETLSMNKPILTVAIASLWLASLNAHSAGYKEVTVENGGTVNGVVNFTGDDPAPMSYTVTKDNEACGTGTREVDFVRVENGHLLDTVVYLEKVTQGKPFPDEVGDAAINQKGCVFSPFLQIMRNDHKLASVNDDQVLHNFHTYELIKGTAKGPKKTKINISQPDTNTVSSTVKLRRGPAMKVECDAHDFMHSFVFVAKNPYFAVVKEDGSYTIDNIPPGSYSIRAWHGMLENQKAKVEVTGGKSATVDFTFK